MSHKHNSFALWSGPSELDGKPIVALATIRSDNSKTGDVPQIAIMRADVNPIEALKTGDDYSVCGGCGHRPELVASSGLAPCYVTVAHGPLSVWKSWKRGTATGTRAKLVERAREVGMIRLGSYGDPAAVPAHVWARLEAQLGATVRIVGYTHQWASPTTAPSMARWVMASADSTAERKAARSAGYRTFRIRSSTQPGQPGEIACPASAEMNNKATCSTCRACDGMKRGGKRPDVVIVAH